MILEPSLELSEEESYQLTSFSSSAVVEDHQLNEEAILGHRSVHNEEVPVEDPLFQESFWEVAFRLDPASFLLVVSFLEEYVQLVDPFCLENCTLADLVAFEDDLTWVPVVLEVPLYLLVDNLLVAENRPVEDNLQVDNGCGQFVVIQEGVLEEEVVASFLVPLNLVSFGHREVEMEMTEVAFQIVQRVQVDLASSASMVFVLLVDPSAALESPDSC